jgi:hypothetical protein
MCGNKLQKTPLAQDARVYPGRDAPIDDEKKKKKKITGLVSAQ